MTERASTLRDDLESLRIERESEMPRRRGRRWWRWLLVAGLVLVGIWAAAQAARSRAVAVETAAVLPLGAGEDTSVPVLSGSGYIVTGDRYVSLGVRVPGRIERYFVEEGESVRQGDSLVQIDDRDYHSAVERAEASLNLARANRALAEAELSRGKALVGGRVISAQEFDVLVNRAAVARAVETQTEAELNQARVNLEYTLVRAPTDGVILAKLKEVGEIAVPGGFAGSGDLIRMANLSEMRAEVDVNEADLRRVRLGQAARVIPDAYPDAQYAAEVVKFYPQVDRQKGTLKVEVRIAEPDERLLPDMSARITFLEALPPERADDPQVTIPAAALRSEGGSTFAWVVRDGRARRSEIETAGAIGERIRVTRGLQEGEAVVVSPDDPPLRDGAAVEPAP
jgi:RND family efflux transporter MFP subunit